jgi:hypothetical protein
MTREIDFLLRTMRLATDHPSSPCINIYNQTFNIKTVDRVKICGKTFSLDSKIEEAENVTKQVSILKAQLANWSKRNLSTDGRILVAKTFGISQIIYQMQNTFFNNATIKHIESIVYRYIWKGPDKIKRCTIKKDYLEGGLKGPCIEALDATLKLKQVARASMSFHDIQQAQKTENCTGKMIVKTYSTDEFVKKGVEVFNQTGVKVLKEMLKSEDSLIHKSHFVMVGNMKVLDFAEMTLKINPIVRLGIVREGKKDGITSMKDLCDKPVSQLPSQCKKIRETLADNIARQISNFEALSRDETVIRIGLTCMAIHLNIFRDPRSIKHRDLFFHANLTEEQLELGQKFAGSRKILHPRERMIHYMDLHNKTYTNERLAKFKMVDSAACKTCQDKTETRDHLFVECPRAETAWRIYSEVTSEKMEPEWVRTGPPNSDFLNVFSLVKHQILCGRDKPINEGLLRVKCENRINDLKSDKYNKWKTRERTMDAKKLLGKVAEQK